MTEGTQDRPENPGVERDVASTGDEGRRAADASPLVGGDAEPGQTSSPAPPGDVGAPSDEELAEEEQDR